MAKLILMKKEEISVPEGIKGKQIAVKEANITSLNNFYTQNYQPPVENVEPLPSEAAMVEEVLEETPVIEQPVIENNNAENIVSQASTDIPLSVEEPNESVNNVIEPISEPEIETPAINLGENVTEETEELDPELQEIKKRLDQVINDLNNYKKKIKLLEIEVNQNLEKSKEVLKDTQAAAKIMSIQQERQRQINEEVGGTSTLEDDSIRTLQKEAA